MDPKLLSALIRFIGARADIAANPTQANVVTVRMALQDLLVAAGIEKSVTEDLFNGT